MVFYILNKNKQKEVTIFMINRLEQNLDYILCPMCSKKLKCEYKENRGFGYYCNFCGASIAIVFSTEIEN